MSTLVRARSCTSLVLAFSCAVAPLLQAAIPASERAALIDLYESTGGDDWAYNEGWKGPPGTECSWYRVHCDTDGTHVIELDFGPFTLSNTYNLTGTLPESLRDLSRLQRLLLGSNHLTGPIPAIAGWSQIETLDLSENELSGSIPPLTDVPKLKAFDASQNRLTGSIPPVDRAPALETFNVSGNRLSGALPRLATAPNLYAFDAHGNELTGSIPSLGGRLAVLDLSGNRLTGTIPPLSNVPSLIGLMVNNNLLTGSIPSLESVPELLVLRVSNNALTGTLPSFEPNHLFEIRADNNHLTGTIPPSLSKQNYLRVFAVANNDLTGDVPPFPGVQPYDSSLCPNRFNVREGPSWDAATGVTPWYTECTHVNLNQFGLTGSWYNPATSGQGILLDALPDFGGAGSGYLFGGWFTYEPAGSTSSPALRWYSFQGAVDASSESAVLGLYETEGGSFAGPPVPTTSAIGSITLAFHDCAQGTLSYHFEDGRVGDGSMPLTRLTQNAACTILGESGSEAASAYFSGTWYDPETSGQGLLIHISPTQTALFAAWYTFAPAGTSADPATSQRWYTLQRNSVVADTATIDNITIFSTSGGFFGSTVPPQIAAVGTAQMTFESCEALTLVYEFSDGDNQGLAGTLHLVRLGPTPDGCESTSRAPRQP